jgi:hypothetical protein
LGNTGRRRGRGNIAIRTNPEVIRWGREVVLFGDTLSGQRTSELIFAQFYLHYRRLSIKQGYLSGPKSLK